MSRRAVVLMLAAVIALAVAIPALADSGTSAKSASVKGLSTRALARAKASLRTARAAKRDVHKATAAAAAAQTSAAAAQSSANAALSSANTAGDSASSALKQAASADEKAGGAQLRAEEARSELDSTRPRIGFAEGSSSTESPDFVKLPDGPSVTVTVPPTGLIQVWAQALISSDAGVADGAVSLFEDGQQVGGQAVCDEIEGVLFSGTPLTSEPELVGTPAVQNRFGSCGSVGAPGPVLFHSTTGEHTFELRYASCTCGGAQEEMSFSERRLVVAPLP